MKLGVLQDIAAAFVFTLATAGSPPCDDGMHPTHWDAHTRQVSIDYRLDWCLMKAQLLTENHTMDPHARSHAGAVGCAQFLPSTWGWLEERYGITLDIYDCKDAISMFGRRIRELIDDFTERGADDPRAFAYAAYNRGENGVLRTVKKVGKGLVWRLVKDSLPMETIRYVGKIRRLASIFRS